MCGPRRAKSCLGWRLRPKTRININVDAHVGPRRWSKLCIGWRLVLKTRININVDAQFGPRGGQSHAMNSLLRPKMRININGDAHIGLQMCSKSCLKHGLAGVWSLKTHITINVDARVGPQTVVNIISSRAFGSPPPRKHMTYVFARICQPPLF